MTEKTLKILEKTFQGGFGVMPFNILRNGKIPMQEKVLYLNLLSYAWYGAECFPGRTKIAKDMGISNGTLRKYLNSLRMVGLIDWKRRGLNKTNIYYINEIPEYLKNPIKQSKSEADGYPYINPDGYPYINKVDEVKIDEDNNGVIALSADKDNPSLRVVSLLGKDRAGDGVDVEMVDNPIDDLSLQGNDPSTIARLESRRAVEGALEFYFQMYPQKIGEDHPHLVEDQLLEVIKKLRSEGLLLDEWKKVITHWFNCVNIETDYNINHFVSGQIIQNRMFELEKCGKCQISKWNN